MKSKFKAIWNIMWSYNYVAITDNGINGRTSQDDNGKYIKSLIEATLKAKGITNEKN